MSSLIILVCIVPPLAVMAIAAIHGYRTANAGVLAILVLSLGLLAGPALLATQNAEPAPSFRFDVVNGSGHHRFAALPQRPDAARPEQGL